MVWRAGTCTRPEARSPGWRRPGERREGFFGPHSGFSLLLIQQQQQQQQEQEPITRSW